MAELHPKDASSAAASVARLPKGHKVAEDVAKADFDRWTGAMGLEVDTETMDTEDKATFLEERDRLVRAMQRGQVVVLETAELEFTPERSKDKSPITFHEHTGATLMATDDFGPDKSVHKLYAILADVSGQPIQRFSQMQGADCKICRSIGTLFLGG
jgi:hypothetical protein